MAQITKEITVDVAKKNLFQAIVAKQNDNNSRFLKVTLCNEGVKIEVPSTATALINAERADNSSKAFAGTVNADGTVTVPLTNWMLGLDDVVRCSISVIGSDEQKLTSTSFSLDVEAAEYEGSDITEDENYDILITLISDVSDAKLACETATTAANSATDIATQAANTANEKAIEATNAAQVANAAANAVDSAIERTDKATAAANSATGEANTAATNATNAATAANDAKADILAAKERGEFDGKDGAPGKDGINGKDGENGITPHIGTNGNWYIGETDTRKPSRGNDGDDGIGFTWEGEWRYDFEQNGLYSINDIVSYNRNTYIRIPVAKTRANEPDPGEPVLPPDESIYWNLYVPKGEKGADGAPGAKGESAYELYKKNGGTLTEKQWLASLAQVAPTFVQSVDEMTDTSKIYVMPDGYIYGYMTKTIEGGLKEVVVDVTDGFTDNTRLSVSSGNTSTLAGFVTTPFIDFSQYPIDAEIRLSGISWAADANNTSGYSVVVYDENKAMVAPLYLYLGEHGDATPNMKYIANSATDVVFKAYNTSAELGFKYVRFCGKGTSANAVVKIVYTEEREAQTVTEWTNTGHAFVPADYENRIIDLEEISEQHQNDIEDHEDRITTLESSTDVPLPDYWVDHMAEKAEDIQIAMETAGRNKSAFLWYTDAHWKYTNAKVSPLLLQYLIKNTPMNKVNFGGDIVSDPSELTHEQIPYVYEWRKATKGLPNHHSVIGNHDNLHKGRNDSDVSDLVYSFLLASEESADMVMGGDFYYYIDNSCEKTRYLYLDSGRYSLDDVETKFIIDSLTSVPNGWHIVVISHIWFQYTSPSAPTVGNINTYMRKALDLFDAYNARQSGSITMVSTAQSYNFTSCGGKVEFCIGGHIHVDHEVYSTGGIPVILTASDTNQDRSSDEDEDSGTIGTTTESAVFGIVADYDNSKITIVGVGRGGSREIDF